MAVMAFGQRSFLCPINQKRPITTGFLPLTICGVLCRMAHTPEVVSDIFHISGVGDDPTQRKLLDVVQAAIERAGSDPAHEQLPKLLTESQAAKYAGCSRKQIRTLIDAGRLKATDLSTGKHRHYRIARDDLKALPPQPREPQTGPWQRQRARRQPARQAAVSIFPAA